MSGSPWVAGDNFFSIFSNKFFVNIGVGSPFG